MEAQSFKIEIKIGTFHAKIPVAGDLIIVLKDEDTRINQQQSKVQVDTNQSRTTLNQTYTYISKFQPISYGAYEQRYVSLTFQLSTEGNIKPLGINRLEMSQFLQNPLGKSQSYNLKILKCQYDTDAFVSLTITILEQIQDRLTDDSFKSETSSRISSDARSSVVSQSQSNTRSENSNQSQNNTSLKVLAQSRSEKNFTGMKFKKNAIRLVNQQSDQQQKESHSQSPDDKSVLNILNKNQQPLKVTHQINSQIPNNRIDNLIKSLHDDDRDQQIKQQNDQILTLKKQAEVLLLENQELRSIKEQQEMLIIHLKQRVQISDPNSSLEMENQNLRKQLQDFQGKYQHLLSVLRDQQSQMSPRQKHFKSINTTEEDEQDHNSRPTEALSELNNIFDSREEFKQMPQLTINDKYNYLKRKLIIIISDKESIESQLVHAKMQWATIELERDNLAIRLHHQQEKFNQLINEHQQLQTFLVKTKQELGEALNSAYEFEKVNRTLLDKYGEEAKDEEIKELNIIRQESKDTLESKKASKAEKKPSRIKKFFKK